MTTNIVMPALSPTMTEGKLAKWLVNEGDAISPGDVIAEVETDKATMEIEAVDAGRLSKLLVPEGTENVPVNDVIALLSDVRKAVGDDEATMPVGSGDASQPPAGSSSGARSKRAGVRGNGRVVASPLARRLAGDAGIDLVNLHGTGPGGRIVRADVEAAMAARQPQASTIQAAAAPQPAATLPGAKDQADRLGLAYRQEPLTGMRRTIAQRLTAAKQQVPHFYLTVDCRLDKLLALRNELNARLEREAKLSINDFIIRTAALALAKVPAANASYDESGLLYYQHADISVAVATPAGLLTPVVRHAEIKGLATIAGEMRDLVARARDGKLKPEDYQGGTFSVSNLGMYGVKQFEAVINPPQGCILAAGAAERRPVVVEEALGIATVMSCTLSVDHRVVDGAVGAEFLNVFQGLIEDPIAMLL